MAHDWLQLTKMTGERQVVVERVRVVQDDISVEGEFELPPLARLSAEDQVFVAAFVKGHGSIKEMEKTFGISYPTVKGRLNRIAEKFDFIEIEEADDKREVLDQLDRGEISAEEALEILKR